jgi:hypothetical protein
MIEKEEVIEFGMFVDHYKLVLEQIWCKLDPQLHRREEANQMAQDRVENGKRAI